MDEYVIKQKIQKACIEPQAPEELIQKMILRTQAVSMGVDAQKRLRTAPAEKLGELAAYVLIGQLAAVSELPKGAHPKHLAEQLEKQPAFLAALRGGNVVQRLNNGELLQQLTGQKPPIENAEPQISVPQKNGPVVG
jgi:hypothetical protein